MSQRQQIWMDRKRIAPFDIGVDEISKETIKARILNPADVGAGLKKMDY